MKSRDGCRRWTKIEKKEESRVENRHVVESEEIIEH